MSKLSSVSCSSLAKLADDRTLIQILERKMENFSKFFQSMGHEVEWVFNATSEQVSDKFSDDETSAMILIAHGNEQGQIGRRYREFSDGVREVSEHYSAEAFAEKGANLKVMIGMSCMGAQCDTKIGDEIRSMHPNLRVKWSQNSYSASPSQAVRLLFNPRLRTEIKTDLITDQNTNH